MKNPINACWDRLALHAKQIKSTTMDDLFAADPMRAERFTLGLNGLHFDYSKNIINDETIKLLQAWAESMQLGSEIKTLFSTHPINSTESQPALHWAMRWPSPLADTALEQQLADHWQRSYRMAESIREKKWLGYSGQPITDILHIGIGGSELGPALLADALKPYHDCDVRCHFLASNDQAELELRLADLSPATTLVLLVSKSFRSVEVHENRQRVFAWLANAAGRADAWRQQTIAITARPELAQELGLAPEFILPMWDWLGGRFSIGSAVSFSTQVQCGPEVFKQFLAGQAAADQHFLEQPLRKNIPVTQALLSLWYNHFFSSSTQVILAYADRLRRFSSYVQQLQMESLGKSVNIDGQPIDYPTGMITWGGVGPQTQHSFHQLLMQGTRMTPADFILPIISGGGHRDNSLCANAIAQAHILMNGYLPHDSDPLQAHKKIEGNRPSNFFLLPELNAYQMGQLVTLYEHKVYCTGVMLHINPFDQWGVERGKKVAQTLMKNKEHGLSEQGMDASSDRLWQLCRERNFAFNESE